MTCGECSEHGSVAHDQELGRGVAWSGEAGLRVRAAASGRGAVRVTAQFAERRRGLMAPTAHFMNQRIDRLDRDNLLHRLREREGAECYRYLVTPNIDHLVRLLRSPGSALWQNYQGADLVICDSRIVELLAGLVGKPIAAYPGADIVKDLLDQQPGTHRVVGLVGPTADHVARLAAQYPAWRFVHYDAPMMEVGSPAFESAVQATLVGEWDVLLICLGFPKQEGFAAALRQQGRRRGIALCVGASVDFLVGAQKRAPAVLQRARLEWLHRLVQNPRRLWRRYLIEGPRILYWYTKIEIMRAVPPNATRSRPLG